MTTLIVMHNKPADPAAFDAHFFKKHMPLAKAVPGIRKFEVSRGPVTTPDGPSPYHLVVMMTFDSVAAIDAAFASAEGKAAIADTPNFTQAGMEFLIFETRPA